MQKNTVTVMLSIMSIAIQAPPMFASEPIPIATKQTSQPGAKKIQEA